MEEIEDELLLDFDPPSEPESDPEIDDSADLLGPDWVMILTIQWDLRGIKGEHAEEYNLRFPISVLESPTLDPRRRCLNDRIVKRFLKL